MSEPAFSARYLSLAIGLANTNSPFEIIEYCDLMLAMARRGFAAAASEGDQVMCRWLREECEMLLERRAVARVASRRAPVELHIDLGELDGSAHFDHVNREEWL